jgi:hypothetical protein
MYYEMFQSEAFVFQIKSICAVLLVTVAWPTVAVNVLMTRKLQKHDAAAEHKLF